MSLGSLFSFKYNLFIVSSPALNPKNSASVFLTKLPDNSTKLKLYCFAFSHRLSNPPLQFLELTPPTLGNTNHVSPTHIKVVNTV